MWSVLLPAIAAVVVAVIGAVGTWVGSRNDRALARDEIALLKQLNPESIESEQLAQVISLRIQRWHRRAHGLFSVWLKASLGGVFTSSALVFAGIALGALGDPETELTQQIVSASWWGQVLVGVGQLVMLASLLVALCVILVEVRRRWRDRMKPRTTRPAGLPRSRPVVRPEAGP